MAEPHPTPATVGHYPVERELGRGGMGVVYLARDPRLNRQVAIKVLPAAFVADPQRLQRFEREARTLAALNHRNVGMIFGLEDDPGTGGVGGGRLLVLEYIPGRSLTDMIVRGPLSVDESVRIALQIAEGLEAAHEREVVHRDLKPDNIRVTPDGVVKILDFGLASAGRQEPAQRGVGLTQEGMIMGTPGYMSPEQARGLPTDKRTDIWAFGCVLYECLSAHRAFGGETVGDCLVAVLEREPDYTVLPARTPNRLRDLLHRLFVKDPRRRLRDVGDARIELEDILAQPQSGWYQAAPGSAGRTAGLARLTMPLGSAPAAGGPQEIGLTNSPRGALAIAPDGSAVALVAGRPPQTMLYLRRLDGHEARAVPGSAGADAPFFSPDGARLGFFADGKLKRVSLSGGAPHPLAAAPRPQGACWAEDDFIYFVPDWQRGLMRVPAGGGGAAETVAEPDLASGELALMAPDVLPGGRHALVSVWTGGAGGHDEALVTAIDLRTRARKPLVHGGGNPRFLPSGHIVFSRGSTLLAVAFDPERLEVFGAPVPVEDRVLGHALGGSSQFAAAGEGTLVLAPGAVWEPRSALALAGRAGDPTPLAFEPRAFACPAVSPGGRLVCVQVQGATDHLYLLDLERPQAPATRLTFHADNACPVFSPDGARVAFRSNMSGRAEIYAMGVDLAGAGQPEPVHGSDGAPTPCAFVPGEGGRTGGTLLFTQQRPGAAGALELWSVRMDDPASARPLVQGPASVWGAAVSPDGRLLAYVSDESGRPEVYVQAYPSGPRRQVSAEGGGAPLWARTGGELYYRAGDQIIAVRVAVEPALMVGRPRTMFQGPAVPATPHARNYDVLPDGQFLIVRAQEDQSRVTSLNVTLNWFGELRRRVPVPQPTPPPQTRLSGLGGYGGWSGGHPSGAPPYPSAPMPSRPHATPIPSSMPTRMDGVPHPPAAPPPPHRPAYPSEGNTIG